MAAWGGVERRDAPGRRGLDNDPTVQVDAPGRGEDRRVVAEVADEVGFRAESQCPHSGMQPIGADHDVELACAGTLERDHHAVVVLGHLGNRVCEQVLNAVAASLVKDLDQVAPQNLDLRDHPARVAKEVGWHPRHVPTGFVDERHATHPGVRGPDLVEQPHPSGRLTPGAADVDRLSAGTRRRSPLHHCDTETVPAEPVRQGGACDARTRDHNAGLLPWCSILWWWVIRRTDGQSYALPN